MRSAFDAVGCRRLNLSVWRGAIGAAACLNNNKHSKRGTQINPKLNNSRASSHCEDPPNYTFGMTEKHGFKVE